ncbi:hypothetical protein M9458_056893 [Cirrhinus mrigala]|uniref:PiggyBac transposable element-derived protein domain-containing protein n=1 Tax=Cirrhinus mrigala TaxID=683832 RepID=A0ABD0MGM9_CIRMR
MPPVQKGHLCSVQDVIAAVQNGESDFEMDSDDTDASDSENEDVGEIDKENHQPIDCPANDDVDVKSQPKKHIVPRDRFRWLKKEFISPNTDFSGSEITNDANDGLSEGQIYKIYTDNYFTCVPLVVKLLERGIHYVGTVRQVRLPNCNLEDENSLKKKGRGSFDVRVEGNHNHLRCQMKIQRWDKATKTIIDVERPYIVDTYNKHMGGVDLLDSFAAKYKFPTKSHRWYIYIFWHTIILAVINGWLLYKRDCKALKMTKKEILNRRQFKAQLASSLILVNAHNTSPKRGRPSSGKTVTSGSPLDPQKRPSSSDVSPPAKRSSDHPPLDVRKDMIAHFPVKTKRGHCRHCNNGYTNTLCSKCNVCLCFSDEKNCLRDYHCK